MLPERESRPGANRTAGVSTATKTSPSIAPPSDILRRLDDLASCVDGAFVVVVKTAEDRYRRRVYLSAKSAENAAKTARDRGVRAEVYLAEVRPVFRVDTSEGGDCA